MNNLQLSGDTATTTGQFLFAKNALTGIPEQKDKPVLFKLISNLNEAFTTAKDKAFEQSQFFGDLITAGDFVIFFGTSNTGKSFLAYQLAEAISRGQNFFDVSHDNLPHQSKETPYYALKNVNQAQAVLFADFESSIEKLTRRYSNINRVHYQFSDNLKVIIPEARSIKNKMLFIDDIEKRIVETGAKFLIVDNLSAIVFRAEESTFASELMNRIKDLQDKHGLTVLVIAHTPKGKQNKLITLDDLQGSANFANLVDSVFAIGKTTTSENLRYLKQLKTRVNEINFSSDKVIVIELKTLSNGFTGYDYASYESEDTLIQFVEKSQKNAERESIKEALTLQLSAYDLAIKFHDEYGSNICFDSYYRKVKRIVKRLKAENNSNPANN